MYKRKIFRNIFLLDLTIVELSIRFTLNYYFVVLGLGPYEEQMSMSRGAAIRRKQ